MADGVEGFDLGLRLKALVRKGCGVGPLALLGAIGLVHEGRLYGLLDWPAAIAARSVTGAVPVTALLVPNIVVLVFEVAIVLAVGVAVGFHLADGPHELAVDVDVSFALVVSACLATKAKEPRAGSVVARFILIPTGKVNRIGTGNVEDVLVVPHIKVVDVQSLLVGKQAGCRVERAIIHVNGNVMLTRGVIGIDIDDFATGIKGAGVKRHGRRAVRPDGVIAIRGVERRVPELGTLIAPVERLAVDDATIDDGLVRANEAKIVRRAGAHRHVLERNGSGAVKGIVAVVLGAKIIGVGNLRTDVPCGLVRAQTLKGKVLALGVTHGAHAVEGIVALAELDGVAALRIGGSVGKFIVGFTGAGVSDARLGSQRRGGAHAQGADHAEQHGGDAAAQRPHGPMAVIRFHKVLHSTSFPVLRCHG